MGISAETRAKIRAIAKELDVVRETLEPVNAAVEAEATPSELAAWKEAEQLVFRGISFLEELGLEEVGD